MNSVRTTTGGTLFKLVLVLALYAEILPEELLPQNYL